jgi:hypothetical protein
VLAIGCTFDSGLNIDALGQLDILRHVLLEGRGKRPENVTEATRRCTLLSLLYDSPRNGGRQQVQSGEAQLHSSGNSGALADPGPGKDFQAAICNQREAALYICSRKVTQIALVALLFPTDESEH